MVRCRIPLVVMNGGAGGRFDQGQFLEHKSTCFRRVVEMDQGKHRARAGKKSLYAPN